MFAKLSLELIAKFDYKTRTRTNYTTIATTFNSSNDAHRHTHTFVCDTLFNAIPISLKVRISPFQGENAGSNPALETVLFFLLFSCILDCVRLVQVENHARQAIGLWVRLDLCDPFATRLPLLQAHSDAQR